MLVAPAQPGYSRERSWVVRRLLILENIEQSAEDRFTLAARNIVHVIEIAVQCLALVSVAVRAAKDGHDAGVSFLDGARKR